MASSFAERTPLLEAIDVVFGIAILADFAARPPNNLGKNSLGAAGRCLTQRLQFLKAFW